MFLQNSHDKNRSFMTLAIKRPWYVLMQESYFSFAINKNNICFILKKMRKLINKIK